MDQKKEAARKTPEKKPSPFGNNVVWYLLALGVGTLVLVSLLQNTRPGRLPLSDLKRLVALGADPDGPAHVDVVEESTDRVVRYSDIDQLILGPYEITGTGTVHQIKPDDDESLQPTANTPFRTNWRADADAGAFQKLLDDNKFRYSFEEAPGG